MNEHMSQNEIAKIIKGEIRNRAAMNTCNKYNETLKEQMDSTMEQHKNNPFSRMVGRVKNFFTKRKVLREVDSFGSEIDRMGDEIIVKFSFYSEGQPQRNQEKLNDLLMREVNDAANTVTGKVEHKMGTADHTLTSCNKIVRDSQREKGQENLVRDIIDDVTREAALSTGGHMNQNFPLPSKPTTSSTPTQPHAPESKPVSPQKKQPGRSRH